MNATGKEVAARFNSAKAIYCVMAATRLPEGGLQERFQNYITYKSIKMMWRTHHRCDFCTDLAVFRFIECLSNSGGFSSLRCAALPPKEKVPKTFHHLPFGPQGFPEEQQHSSGRSCAAKFSVVPLPFLRRQSSVLWVCLGCSWVEKGEHSAKKKRMKTERPKDCMTFALLTLANIEPTHCAWGYRNTQELPYNESAQVIDDLLAPK